MPSVCPTITAFNQHDYRDQMDLVSSFASRIHIDLMDGQFTHSTSPNVNQSWWPAGISADMHLMYKYPETQTDMLIKLSPSLVIIHYEAEVDHRSFAKRLKENGIRAGLALLQDTTVDQVKDLLPEFDHFLIFSGNLGYHGGEADLSLLGKVREVKEMFPSLEIAWDGGINDQNASELLSAGVSVLNVGGFIHSSTAPASAYAKLEALAG